LRRRDRRHRRHVEPVHGARPIGDGFVPRFVVEGFVAVGRQPDASTGGEERASACNETMNAQTVYIQRGHEHTRTEN